jgi:serine/threonine-protein kinase RsbW
VEITLGLVLPREEHSIPVARHVCRHALRDVGVEPDCGADIEIALSEACTNALKHAGPGSEYQVHLSIDDGRCAITIADAGRGFDGRSSRSNPADERGRGIELMEALVDRVKFEVKPETGTIVHLEKKLSFADGSLARRSSARSGHGAEG